ncbi:G-type lectin S-receptor-like serine/threonine-protein kinase LRK4 [Ancistrocladus abbreviatus]
MIEFSENMSTQNHLVRLSEGGLCSATIFVFQPNSKRLWTAQPYDIVPGTSARRFRYDELEEATNNFSQKVGQGAFSTVYKGTVDSETGTIVAVRKLDELVRESEKEFQTEISAIARTNHRNLVELVGFCSEGQHRLLVSEFMTNGSLSDFLFGEQRPCWYKRVQITIGTARGLKYLHEECGTQIIHCDIKPQNVLLDDSFIVRICDFRLANLLKTDQTRTTTSIRGTKGYVVPEWFRNLPITVKVDVYSYGILLLELVCCRKCLELEADEATR